jgi:hypothetical protein
VDVLHTMIDAVRPGGIVLDLQVIRPQPVVEIGGTVVCTIDGGALFRTADPAVAAIDAAVRDGLLVDQAVDDHDVLKHYRRGRDLIADFEGKQRHLPHAALPALEAHEGPCLVREHCRLRRLAVR